MDIRKKAVDETSVLHLRDAEDKLMYEPKLVEEDGVQKEVDDLDKPITVTLFGPGTKAFARAQTEKNNRMVERLKRKGKNADLTPAERIAEDANFLTTCTKAMSGIEIDQLAGDHLFRAVYSDQSIGFIASQVNAHLGDWANFSKGSTKT